MADVNHSSYPENFQGKEVWKPERQKFRFRFFLYGGKFNVLHPNDHGPIRFLVGAATLAA